MLKLLPLALAAFSAALYAQDAGNYDGTWRGIFVGQGGSPRFEVELVLDGTGGTWQAVGNPMQARGNPCLGRKHEVKIRERSACVLRFSVDASKTLAGCQDFYAAVKLVDDHHLEGQFRNGLPLKLERK
jgi:hypothetical protein